MPRAVAQRMFTTTLARTRNQSFWQGAFAVVHSCCRKFLKHVHNLFTRPLWLPSPAGLRLEISSESDKKKMNFIFNYAKKIFLTGKMKRACGRENKKQCVEKFREPAATDFESPHEHFSGSWLRHPELTESICAGNFSPLRATRRRSASCRCSQPIPIPPGVFRCALLVRTSP